MVPYYYAIVSSSSSRGRGGGGAGAERSACRVHRERIASPEHLICAGHLPTKKREKGKGRRARERDCGVAESRAAKESGPTSTISWREEVRFVSLTPLLFHLSGVPSRGEGPLRLAFNLTRGVRVSGGHGLDHGGCRLRIRGRGGGGGVR